METAEKKALLLKDPRIRELMHRLEEILRVAVCAVLGEADGWAGVALWGQAKLPWLRQFLPWDGRAAGTGASRTACTGC